MPLRLHSRERLAMRAHICSVNRPRVQVLALFASTFIGIGVPDTASAVDGCKLLLCMAGDWRHISECTPTVRQALRDVARGRGWPRCSLMGGSASANQFVAPEQCPPQYQTVEGLDENNQSIRSCPFSGVILLSVDHQPWSRTWWSPSGESVVEWLPAARAALANTPGSMGNEFEQTPAADAGTAQGAAR